MFLDVILVVLEVVLVALELALVQGRERERAYRKVMCLGSGALAPVAPHDAPCRS